jgi:hypothetical protein
MKNSAHGELVDPCVLCVSVVKMKRKGRVTNTNTFLIQFAATHAVRTDGVSVMMGSHESPRSRET